MGKRMPFDQVEKAALLLGSSQPPDALLRAFLTASSEDAGADEAVLYTMGEGSHELVPAMTVGMPDGETVNPLAVGEGAGGRAAADKAAVVIADTRSKRALPHSRNGMRSVFAAPVFASDGRVLGAIEHHFAEPHRPSDVDLYRSSMYARLVAAVIEHVRFRDQDDVREALSIRRRSELTAVAGELLASSLDWQTTLDHVARVALPALADLCVVSVVDDSRPLARAAAAHLDVDKEVELRRRLLGSAPSSLERAVHASGRSALRSEIETHSLDGLLLKEFGVSAALVLPLVMGDRKFGVVTFCVAESGRHYRPEDLAIAEMLTARAAQALEHAFLYSKMQRAVQARDEFLAIASHDLRNLVAIVKMNANYLLRVAPPIDRRGGRKQIESINSVAERMNELVRDLLDTASIDAGQFAVRPIRQSLRALLEDAGQTAQPLADERGLTLEVELPAEDIDLRCDPTRIHQVLTNLIGNALKFTPNGRVRVSALVREDDVRFEVRDEGVGIDGEDVGRIFDRFWRGQPSGLHGVGLGLYIAKSIVEAHGGAMSVESQPGVGSTFRFTIPR